MKTAWCVTSDPGPSPVNKLAAVCDTFLTPLPPVPHCPVSLPYYKKKGRGKNRKNCQLEVAALRRRRDVKVGQRAAQTLRKEDDMRVTQEHTFLVVRCRVSVREVGGGGWGGGRGRGMTRGNLSKPWRRSHESAYSRFYQTCRHTRVPTAGFIRHVERI